MEVAPDRAHDHFSRVEPDTDVDGKAERAVDLLGVPFHRLLHPERGIARADGVVLVGKRRAEKRHDPVTQHLIHRPLVVVHSLHHPLQHGVEEAAGVFWIAISQQFGRALQIGEQHRDLLALAFESVLRPEDLLGEVLRGVCGQRVEAGRGGRRRRRHPMAAIRTELCGLREDPPAARAGRRKRCPALRTELRLRRNVVPALKTIHATAASP